MGIWHVKMRPINHFTLVETQSGKIMLWTGYKQVENYKTRQVLLIHQLVLIC
jgi:hypothetical protein